MSGKRTKGILVAIVAIAACTLFYALIGVLGSEGTQYILWKRVAVGLLVAVFASGLLSFLVRWGLVEKYGAHAGSVPLGRSLTEHRYVLDDTARQRIRRITLIVFLVAAVLIFACAWSTILSPEHFGEIFAGG